LLLLAGVDSMALRYPLALAGAYTFFLCLLWLWVSTKADDYFDLPTLRVRSLKRMNLPRPSSPLFSLVGWRAHRFTGTSR
jgi:hypothetical protein